MFRYENMHEGIFLKRPNRFIAHVEIGGIEEICHVKNTGRCRELLVPGATVWCQHHDDPERKTKWSLITVKKGDRLINMDSQVPNGLAREYVQSGGLGFVPELVRPEQTWGTSRFDLYFEAGQRKGFVEVKGVTLETDGVVRFPDAPTERGRKHLQELQKAADRGLEAWVLFMVQMSQVSRFEPNRETDPAFAEELLRCREAGVHIRAVTCQVTPDSLTVDRILPVCL